MSVSDDLIFGSKIGICSRCGKPLNKPMGDCSCPVVKTKIETNVPIDKTVKPTIFPRHFIVWVPTKTGVESYDLRQYFGPTSNAEDVEILYSTDKEKYKILKEAAKELKLIE